MNQPDEKFCGGCGAPLATDASQPLVAPRSRESEAARLAGECRQLTLLFYDLRPLQRLRHTAPDCAPTIAVSAPAREPEASLAGESSAPRSLVHE